MVASKKSGDCVGDADKIISSGSGNVSAVNVQRNRIQMWLCQPLYETSVKRLSTLEMFQNTGHVFV
jgi:hypothetical protein